MMTRPEHQRPEYPDAHPPPNRTVPLPVRNGDPHAPPFLKHPL
jgi:hypothetical protein